MINDIHICQNLDVNKAYAKQIFLQDSKNLFKKIMINSILFLILDLKQTVYNKMKMIVRAV